MYRCRSTNLSEAIPEEVGSVHQQAGMIGGMRGQKEVRETKWSNAPLLCYTTQPLADVRRGLPWEEGIVGARAVSPGWGG
jgi:hypothetical protein